MPTVTPVTALEVFNRARFFLNDKDAAIYRDGDLIEPLNVSIDDLREQLQDNDVSITAETSAAIEVEAGVTDIGGDSGVALPNDFLVPIQLWERTAGTTQDFVLMQKKDFLPKISALSSFLIYWTYQDQIIKFLGATSDIEVKIDYRANRINMISGSGSQVNLKNAFSYLAYQTAGYAAEFIGENKTRADSLYARADNALGLLLNLDVKNKQNQVSRRRPFMGRYKQGGAMYR